MSSMTGGRDGTARLPARLGAVLGSATPWGKRARQAGFVGTTLLLLWEIRITPLADLPVWSTAFRLAMVLLLYGLPRWPQAVALLSLPVLVGEYFAGFHHLSTTLVAPMVITAYLIATLPRYRGYLYAIASVGLFTAVYASEQPVADVLSWSAVFLIPCIVGEGARYGLASIERIRHVTAAQLRHQRRIVARELHDTSIHDITSLIMALERAKLRGIEDPELLAEIDHAAAMARQSVVSMRGVLNILREEGDGTARLGDPHAVERQAATDRSVATVSQALRNAEHALARAGHSPQVHVEDGIEAAMPSSVQLALIRVIQECTVNMVKYAKPGTSCALMVERTATATLALFINEYDGHRVKDTALSSGLGLIGIRERVAVVGGTLSINNDDQRWMVQVAIPTIASTTEGQPNRALQQ
ncbi:sensor histidine kinase [Georgenia sp. MJ170]|uniref:sensor histidine kinase n=1 Tax=Georgenia sunbinii TaxID=3117728 RepID=UPI002F266F13